MSIIDNLLGRHKTSAATKDAQDKLAPCDRAIQLARSGQLPVEKMLEQLVNGALLIPLAEPLAQPISEGFKWKPATLTKSTDGSKWLVAFTDSQLGSNFSQANSAYSFVLCVETKWVLSVIPPVHGLVVNISSDKIFEWSAEGLARYVNSVLK